MQIRACSTPFFCFFNLIWIPNKFSITYIIYPFKIHLHEMCMLLHVALFNDSVLFLYSLSLLLFMQVPFYFFIFYLCWHLHSFLYFICSDMTQTFYNTVFLNCNWKSHKVLEIGLVRINVTTFSACASIQIFKLPVMNNWISIVRNWIAYISCC